MFRYTERVTEGSLILAEARDVAELQQALRQRADQLNISRETIDSTAGFSSGYSGKVLSQSPMKSCIGQNTLGPLLGALAVKLLVVEDREQFERIKNRLEPRAAERARNGNRNWETHRMSQMDQPPRYELISPDDREFVTFNCMPARVGRVVDFFGWPEIRTMKAVNEPARRIYEFAKIHQFNNARPLTPQDAIGGAIYLPVLVGGYREGQAVTTGMPRYIAPNHNFELRGRFVPMGQEFAWVAWPAFGLESANEAAARVVDYLEANREHPRLPLSPWNDYDNSLWLPDLPEIRRGPGAVPLQPLAAAPSHDEFRRGNLLPEKNL